LVWLEQIDSGDSPAASFEVSFEQAVASTAVSQLGSQLASVNTISAEIGNFDARACGALQRTLEKAERPTESGLTGRPVNRIDGQIHAIPPAGQDTRLGHPRPILASSTHRAEVRQARRE